MNELLLQMILARASADGNPAVADMLARMRASADGNSGLDIQELLAQQSQTNPTVGLLAKRLAELKANGSSRQSPTVIDVEATKEKPVSPDQPSHEPQDDSTAALSELREHVESLLAEIKRLRDRNDVFAAAVGACCLCWGQNIDCRSCRGRGGPGFCIPDESLFEELVLPAIRTLRAQRTKMTNASPGVPPKTDAVDARLQQ
jgi:hypothetical protein